MALKGIQPAAKLSFKHFLEALSRDREALFEEIVWTRPMCRFITKTEKDIMTITIYKFEQYEEGVKKMTAMLGIPNTINECYNYNVTQHKGMHAPFKYESVYREDMELCVLVEDLYAEDFEAFGYVRVGTERD
jgi:hypothetical protein